MTKSFAQELALYDQEEYSEPELEDDVFNPANNAYKRTLASLQRRIRSLAIRIKPKYAMIARAYASGTHTNTELAKRYRCHPTTVALALKHPEVKDLIGCIKYMHHLQEGTRAIDREMMLWGIASREQEVDPRTSIAAISEINRMKTDTDAQIQKAAMDTTLQSSPTIIIQLADSRLVPSALDAPATQPIKDVN